MSNSRAQSKFVKSMKFGLALALANLVWPIGASHGQAVPTGPVALANVPLFSSVIVQPNVMYTLDNSGSMGWFYAPMWVNNSQGRHCTTHHEYNNLYYNPNLVYVPPITATGTRFANSSYTNAWQDGFHTGDGTINLSTQYPAVGNFNLDGGSPAQGGAFYMIRNNVVAVPDGNRCPQNAAYTVVNVNLLTAAQQTNFANWYSYYRSRILSMKTSVGEAFRTVDDKFRVGFHTIINPGGGGNTGRFLAVDTFTGSQRTNWYQALYEQYVPGNTPLRAAQWRIGEYFKSARSPANGSTLTGINDPIQFSCQQNYHILSTDGQWNSSAAGAPLDTANNDNVLPNSPDLLTVLGKEFSTTFLPGDPWPAPYREKAGSPSAGNLADLAAYYWMTDLRPAMTNNVSVSSGNLANWQHMVTFGVAFSEQGSIPYPSGLAAVASGASEWPLPVPDSASAVDDLWHSALIGHGQYFNVTSPVELMSALGRALNEIRARAGSAAGAEFSGSDLTAPGGAVAYRPGFTAGDWSGDLRAFPVDSTTGVVSLLKHWSAQELLDAKALPAGPGGGWQVNRKIVTWRNDLNAAVPFYWANLSPAQQATIHTNPVTGAKIIDFLRGDRSNEDAGAVTRLFRQRTSVLGDITNSEPRLVAKPNELYSEAFSSGYTAFKAAQAGRRPVVYVGSNDGMLHAFDGTIGNATSGQELWAFVPGLSFQAGVDGLASLSWRNSDPLPNQFEHRFRVDQSPTVKDINFGETDGSAGVDWRTILVSGMNKGGRGYFALDVTDPEAAGETAVAAKVLWQFTGEFAGDTRMGLSFGEPLVIRTRRWGWVVAVSSGYNNGAGTGHIWLLNARTGAVLHRFDSGFGSAAVPSGLARINLFMKTPREHIAEQIYASDLMGNVHRFDVSSGTAAGWTISGTRIASVGRMLTTAPTAAANPFNASERWVYFGSGRLLALADLTPNGANSIMYAIKDGGTSAPATFGSPLTLGDLTNLPLNGTVPSSNLIKGWYSNMASNSHIVTAASTIRSSVVWSTTTPVNDPCTPGASSETYARAMGNGANLVVGGTSISAGANVVKRQALKLVNTAYNNSKGKYKLNFSYGDGTGGPGAKDATLDFNLTGGRTGVRFITTQ